MLAGVKTLYLICQDCEVVFTQAKFFLLSRICLDYLGLGDETQFLYVRHCPRQGTLTKGEGSVQFTSSLS
jgi:hypothetical protein